jgi:CRISPR-associated protein Cas1
MSTLILDRSNLELRQNGGVLTLYENGEHSGSVPLALLDRVVLQGTIQLDTAVLTHLAEAGVATLLLSRRQSRRIAILLGSAHQDATVRIAQTQAALDTGMCVNFSRWIVTAKLRAQLRVLHQALQERPDCRKPLTDACNSLSGILQGLRSAVGIDAMRGMEGAAAAAYFRGLAALFAPQLDFTGRNRRPPRDPVNACLSLGYTLLHFDAVRAAHTAGLDPLIGFYHRPAFGRESLACDLIEPLRPKVDAWIWKMFRARDLRVEDFTFDKGACLLHKAGRKTFYQEYEHFAAAPRRALRRECALLARAFRTAGEPWLDSTDEATED